MKVIQACLLFAVALMLPSAYLFAQVVLPEVDVGNQIAELFLNWKTMSPLLKGAAFVLIVGQLVNQIKEFKYKRLMITALAVVYGAFQLVMNELSWGSAFVTVLVSGGGAVAIYEALKPLLKNVSWLKVGSKK